MVGPGERNSVGASTTYANDRMNVRGWKRERVMRGQASNFRRRVPRTAATRGGAGGARGPAAATAVVGEAPARFVVVLTREDGKNASMTEELENRAGLSTGRMKLMELPALECVRLEGGCEDIKRALRQCGDERDCAYDWIVVTSPEGATVFAELYAQAGGGRPVRIAAVGAATARSLVQASGGALEASFMPSRAIGAALCKELPERKSTDVSRAPVTERRQPLRAGGEAWRSPRIWRRRETKAGTSEEEKTAAPPEENSSLRILYCASQRANDGIEKGLSARGFSVVRGDAYTVRAAESVDVSLLQAEIDRSGVTRVLLTFASPSAVQAWLDLVPASADHMRTAAAAACCIGETTAMACCNAGFHRVYYSDKPGVDGWAAAVDAAMNDLGGVGL